MEYVFGTIRRDNKEVESLKTIGDVHSDLSGFCHVERHYPDNIITDDFVVAEKYQADETDDACLDWYIIEGHSRYTDKFSPVKDMIDTGISEAQDGVCDLSTDMEQRLSEIEDALCEISMR